MSEAFTARVAADELVLGPVRVSFMRTLRIPEEGLHPLPPGLGRFPLRRVEDYPDTVPPEWLARGGVMLPLYQREAMWISLDSDEPAALQIGIGKVCAVSGGAWSETLGQNPQNYAALPDQPWLDGINAGDGFIRQFVAVPLGLGATVEGQVTGAEDVGGVQLRAVGLTSDALEEWRGQDEVVLGAGPVNEFLVCASAAPMGLGAGGRMSQEVYEDDRDLADYAEDRSGRVFVHLCSAAQWTAITGETPPPTPVDRKSYVHSGLPWFSYYDADSEDLPPSSVLSGVSTVGTLLGDEDGPFTPVAPGSVVPIKGDGGEAITDGSW